MAILTHQLLQVDIEYFVPELPCKCKLAFKVVAGEADIPHLPDNATAGRTCFNVGTEEQRTVLSSTPLSLHDR